MSPPAGTFYDSCKVGYSLAVSLVNVQDLDLCNHCGLRGRRCRPSILSGKSSQSGIGTSIVSRKAKRPVSWPWVCRAKELLSFCTIKWKGWPQRYMAPKFPITSSSGQRVLHMQGVSWDRSGRIWIIAPFKSMGPLDHAFHMISYFTV